MPLHYERDDRRRRIVVTTTGIVTLSDVLAIVDRQAGEGAWPYGVLHDARTSDDVPSTTDLVTLVRHVGTLTTRHGPRGPVAFVVAQSALARMGRRYASLGELTSLHVNVFTTIEDAERWLDSRQA